MRIIYIFLISSVILLIILLRIFRNKTTKPYYRLDDMILLPYYRLGDMILLKHERDNKGLGKEHHLIYFPNSIASEYMLQTDEVNNLNILKNIVIKRTTPELTPNYNTLIIHLRIGDVIDTSEFSVDDFLHSQKKYISGKAYVNPLSFYKINLNIIRNKPIEKIILVGGYHTGDEHFKSEEYVQRIKNFFEDNGYIVSTRINNPADDDFIYMSNVKYFISSRGGFSQLTYNMVKLLGGETIN